MRQNRLVEQWVAALRAHWALRKLAPHLSRHERVLNLGSGDGVVGEWIRRRFSSEVVDVDVSDMSLVRSRPPVVYDGKHLPFAGRSFDVVLILFVLHHCTDQQQVVREAARVCRKRVVVMEDTYRNARDLAWLRALHLYLDKMEGMPLSECTFLSPAGWKDLFGQCGLKVAAVRDWPRYMNLLPPGNQLFVLEPRSVGCRFSRPHQEQKTKKPAPFGTGFFVYDRLLPRASLTCGDGTKAPQGRSRAAKACTVPG